MAELGGLVVLLAVALGVGVIALAAALAHQARRPPRNTAGTAIARGLAVDPGELGLAYEAWTLERPGGIQLPVWEIVGAAEGAGDLTVVMVHGWAQSRIDMLARSELWLGCSRRVVMYDQRGHGESVGISNLGRGEEEDLLALIECLGSGPVVVAGYSLGARVAVAAAARSDRPASAQIVGVVGFGLYRAFHPALRRRLWSLGLPARPMTDLAMGWFALRGLGDRPAEQDAAQLRCPLLLVHGAADEICPLFQVHRVVEAAPDGQLVTIEEGAHLDAHLTDPHTHDQAVRRFLARVAGTTSTEQVDCRQP